MKRSQGVVCVCVCVTKLIIAYLNYVLTRSLGSNNNVHKNNGTAISVYNYYTVTIAVVKQ